MRLSQTEAMTNILTYKSCIQKGKTRTQASLLTVTMKVRTTKTNRNQISTWEKVGLYVFHCVQRKIYLTNYYYFLRKINDTFNQFQELCFLSHLPQNQPWSHTWHSQDLWSSQRSDSRCSSGTQGALRWSHHMSELGKGWVMKKQTISVLLEITLFRLLMPYPSSAFFTIRRIF